MTQLFILGWIIPLNESAAIDNIHIHIYAKGAKWMLDISS